MTSIEPIQTPVTGNEYRGNQADSLEALSQFYRALNSRDLSLMEQNWDNSSEVAMDNPLGGIKRGWNEIRTIYERLFQSKGTYHFEFHDYTLHKSNDLFYVVGRERGELVINETTLHLTIRTTRIFRKTSKGTWQQVHHHGSIDNPEMLATYQQAILGAA